MEIIQLADKTFSKSINSDVIQAAIKRIADEMSIDLKEDNPLFIGVLNGAFMFAGDLMQHFNHACGISFVKVKSYEGITSNKEPKEILGLDENIEGRTVVVLEDIIDTGITIDDIVNKLKEKDPKNIKVATLFFKPDVFNKKINIDYIGIEIPDDFIVGFGMDYNGLGRNLKDVYTIKLN